MIVQTDEDLNGIQEISDIVAITLKQMSRICQNRYDHKRIG